ncbi:hypothetical protein [Bradyrhizobium sp. Bra64]|uniref:hypothetical protein n=1 Tax=Bradyrhizobium sp. Bra64 TaxID=2926009 RepID=UPI00211867BE|nr:hypothetical protein [Bradyrhizobium sp. Bra64]
MTKPKPPLSIVGSVTTDTQPPRKLGQHGMALWGSVQAEYRIQDSGGVEMLVQACSGLDRAEALAARVAEDGEVVYAKGVPRAHPCIREELAARAFVVRTLARLGLNVEAIKPVGRPGGGIGWRGD